MNTSSTAGPASAKGQRRRNEILDAAEALFVDGGYGGFSMRRLADNLGMRLSNVQYYFATPDALVDALCDRALDAAREALHAAGKDDLEALVRFLLRSQDSAHSCRLFWELWALAAREPYAANALRRFYAVYEDALASRIAASNPRLTPARCKRRAIHLMAMLEGLSLFRGHGRVYAADRKTLDRTTLELAQMLAHS